MQSLGAAPPVPRRGKGTALEALDKADENGGDVDSDSEGEEADSEAALYMAVREAKELEADDEMPAAQMREVKGERLAAARNKVAVECDRLFGGYR